MKSRNVIAISSCLFALFGVGVLIAQAAPGYCRTKIASGVCQTVNTGNCSLGFGECANANGQAWPCTYNEYPAGNQIHFCQWYSNPPGSNSCNSSWQNCQKHVACVSTPEPSTGCQLDYRWYCLNAPSSTCTYCDEGSSISYTQALDEQCTGSPPPPPID